MAKRTCARAERRARECAPARRSKKPAPAPQSPPASTPPSPRRYVYTDALLANGRHRYEHTEESIPDIALDFGIHKTTLQRLAKRERWVRFKPPPRDLPAAVRLAAQAEALAAARGAMPQPGAMTPTRPPAAGDLPLAGGGIREAAGGGEESAARAAQEQQAPAQEALPSPADTVERLHRAVLNELAAVERMRAMLDAEPQSPFDAERTSRTLSSLTATLQRIQRMQAGLPATGADYDDDIPADLDAIRLDLARRIAAFMESRPDDEDAGEPAGAAADPAAP